MDANPNPTRRTFAAVGPQDDLPFDRARLSRRRRTRPGPGTAVLVLGVSVGTWVCYGGPTAAPNVDEAPVIVPTAVVVANTYNPLLDPAFSLGQAPGALGQISPLGPSFASAAPAAPVVVAEAEPEEAEAPVPGPMPAVPHLEAEVPLPTPRPPELRAPINPGPVRMAGRQTARPLRTASLPATPPDTRTFLQKLFGMPAPSGPVLAYANPEDGIFGNARRITANPALPYDRFTAVYDIAAHTVYMPNGDRLEAHSGLGDRLDDPRHVGDRNVGATPPHVYDLQPREQLFHGVQALRLNPVGGGGVFGRTGLLAHSYMLGPNGDSNGCVSFRNYNLFLEAYKTGTVRRLAVVPRLL